MSTIDPRGFEYHGFEQVAIFQWAFDTVQNAIKVFGLSIEPRDRPLDFAVVDKYLKTPKTIGYIHINMYKDEFRAHIVPKGFKHIESVLSALPQQKFTYDLIRKRIFFIIPYDNINLKTAPLVVVLRRLRFNYALSYWN
jgi:hypothetical protein